MSSATYGGAPPPPREDEAPPRPAGPKRGNPLLALVAGVAGVAGVLVGLGSGYAVWGNPDGGGGRPPAQQAAPPPAPAPPPTVPQAEVLRATVPAVCLAAVERAERALQLVERGAGAVGRLDRAELERALSEVGPLQAELSSAVGSCREQARVDVRPSTPLPP